MPDGQTHTLYGISTLILQVVTHVDCGTVPVLAAPSMSSTSCTHACTLHHDHVTSNFNLWNLQVRADTPLAPSLSVVPQVMRNEPIKVGMTTHIRRVVFILASAMRNVSKVPQCRKDEEVHD